MAAFQFLNPAPVLFTINGVEPVAGGTLSFFDEGTTNPRNTWSDPALTTLNANPLVLDAGGRSSAAIWLDGDYTVVLRDAIGDEVWSRIVRSDVVAGLSIPALAPGFLTNDLTNLIWQARLEVPDPTGSAGYYLSTDGTGIFWKSVNSAVAVVQGVITHQTVTAAASTTIDLALGLAVTLNQAVSITTLAFTNIPATGAFVLSIRRVKDASATARTITWPASVLWPAGAAPTLSSTTGAVDEFSLKYSGSNFTGTYQLAFA